MTKTYDMFGADFSLHVLTTIVVIIGALESVTSFPPTVSGAKFQPVNSANGDNARNTTNAANLPYKIDTTNVPNATKGSNSHIVTNVTSRPNGPNENKVTFRPNATNRPSSTIRPKEFCGIPKVQPARKRIIGGEEARPKSWPWIVLLADMDHRICGGTILNETTILTASHCFDGSMVPERWTVFAGKQHLNITDPQETVHRVESIIQHPLYENSTLKHDIALLVLKEPVIYSEFVRPICIPTSYRRMVPANTMCYSAGWGDTRGTADPYVLNQVGLPLLNDFWCSKKDWYGSQFIPRLTFCAGYSAGRKDDCKGDSGGPYICKVDGQWYQQGIVSWGRDCGRPQWPSVFTDVSKYRKWINDHLDGNGRRRQ